MPINTHIPGSVDSSRKTFVGNFYKIGSLSSNGSQGVLTFNSIPQTYNHLKVIFSAGQPNTSAIWWNSQPANGSYLDYLSYYNYGSTSSNSATYNTYNFSSLAMTSDSNAFITLNIDIFNYTSSIITKSMHIWGGHVNSSTGVFIEQESIYVADSNPITSLNFAVTPQPSSNYFTAGSTIDLYGIK